MVAMRMEQLKFVCYEICSFYYLLIAQVILLTSPAFSFVCIATRLDVGMSTFGP